MAVVAAAAITAMTAQGADNAQINNAIDNGLSFLSSQQAGNGSWAYGAYPEAATGAAVFAMLSQDGRWGSNASTYQGQVDQGIAYLLSTATKNTVSMRADGYNMCPGGTGTCTGVYWYGNGESTYTTGLVAQAIGLYAKGKESQVATTTGPLAGMTWGQIAQGMVNEWAVSQSVSGSYTGGWRYVLGQGSDADMSTTQWGAISLIYMKELGVEAPAQVKSDLAKFLAATQNSSTGAGCYQPGNGLCDQADTGGLLLSLAYLGKTSADPAVQKAIGFLDANWTAGPSGTWYGNFGHPYAMWAEYKGLETLIGLDDTTTISPLLDGDCSGLGSHTGGVDNGITGNAPDSGKCGWWQDYNQWLVTHQNANGSWTGYDYWTGNLATAFYLPILGGTQIPVQPTPEPQSVALVGLALAGLAASRRRRAG